MFVARPPLILEGVRSKTTSPSKSLGAGYLPRQPAPNTSCKGRSMSKKTLICMVGLPRSGKSAIARNLGFPVVGYDSLRLALHGRTGSHSYIEGTEEMVNAITQLMVKSLFLSGHNTVVLDGTNTTRLRRETWQSKKWETLFYPVETSMDDCVLRAREEKNEELVNVITYMATYFDPLGSEERLYLSRAPSGSCQRKFDKKEDYQVEGRLLNHLDRLRARLYTEAPLTLDERRDWANWLDQVFLEREE